MKSQVPKFPIKMTTTSTIIKISLNQNQAPMIQYSCFFPQPRLFQEVSTLKLKWYLETKYPFTYFFFNKIEHSHLQQKPKQSELISN